MWRYAPSTLRPQYDRDDFGQLAAGQVDGCGITQQLSGGALFRVGRDLNNVKTCLILSCTSPNL